MAQPYIGEIRMFAGNFAPLGWEFCEGQLIPISENDALFTLIGTTYGGDGQSTFALPDLRGRIPIHQGGGYPLSATDGVESVTLTLSQIPVHNHPLLASNDLATLTSVSGNVLATPSSATVTAFGTDQPLTQLHPSSITPAGGSQPHNNLQPYLCLNYIISMFGIFPTEF